MKGAGTRAAFTIAVLIGCGARSELGVSSAAIGGAPGGPPPGDDGGDAPFDVQPDADAGIDAPPDAPPDAPEGGVCDGGSLSDPHNCGACGHDCQGGLCLDGVCQPILLTGDEQFPETLAVGPGKVYWANLTDPDYGMPPISIRIRSMSKMGGTPTTLDLITPGWPTSLHHDGTWLYYYRSIYWTVTGQAFVGSINRLCDDGSCMSENLSGAIDNYKWEITLDDDRIFYPASYAGGMNALPKDGGAFVPVLKSPGFYLSRLTVDDSFVYAIMVPNQPVLMQPVMVARIDKTGPAKVVPILKGLVEGADVAVDATDIYFSDNKGAAYRIAKSGVGTATPTVLTPAGVKPGLMAVDDKRVYWLEYKDYSKGIPSSLHWVNKSGGGAGSMTLQNDATAGPGLVVDDTCVYWIATISMLVPPHPALGGIVKVVKPL